LQSDPVDLGSFTVGADGTVDISAQLPANTPAGTHHLYLVDENGVYHLVSEITVAAANSTSAIPALGFEGAPFAALSALLLLAGAVLTVARRRRVAAA
ncbi:MAG: hypothetical protein ABWY36_05370, partial [Leifsonia sp.]